MPLFVKLKDEDAPVEWKILKKRLEPLQGGGDQEIATVLKGATFKCKENTSERSLANTFISEREYKSLIGIKHEEQQNTHSFQAARREWNELSREVGWLMNCFYSIVGLGGFIYFVASFYFESLMERVLCAVTGGIVLFFVEVLLYIIRIE